jgi:glycerophosphoryl diester phosphodiesterase
VRRRLLITAVALLLVAVPLAVLRPLFAVATPPVIACAKVPEVIAHRGGNELWTEETVLAFDTATRLAGVSTWEADVRFDAADVPVMLHDATVDRTTPATGNIADLVASGTTRIATDDGQQIPTEWELLHQASLYPQVRILLELKVLPANSLQWWRFWDRIDTTIGRDRVTVASFDTATIAAVKAQDPTIKTALIQQTGYISAPDVLAQGSEFEKYGPSYTLSRYAEWHAAGIRLDAWTLDDPVGDSWARLVNYPVDGVITDKPIAFAAWLREMCPPLPPTTPPVTTAPTSAVPTTVPTPTSATPSATDSTPPPIGGAG